MSGTMETILAVSYTHLDVYKRQVHAGVDKVGNQHHKVAVRVHKDIAHAMSAQQREQAAIVCACLLYTSTRDFPVQVLPVQGNPKLAYPKLDFPV